MGIIKRTLQNQIEFQKTQTMSATIGTIIQYYPKSNTADISYSDFTGDYTIYKNKVPIANSLGSFTSDSVRSGQTCTIVFINNNPNAPLITGINTSNYDRKTNTDQGAFVIDESIREQELLGDDIKPMCEDWLDLNNTWDNKYKSSIDYSDFDASFMAAQLHSQVDRFEDSEVGLTNLDTKATLKMKKNGDIDIFVSNNVGIRISKATHKIYLYGYDINLNGQYDLSAVLDKCRGCEFKGYRDNNEKKEIKNTIQEYITHIEDDIEELKKCVALTKDITGDIAYFSYLDTSIEKFESLKRKINEGKYDDSVEDLQDAFEQIMKYYDYFEEELVSAREKWGLV